MKNRNWFESLEDRRLFSASVLDQVLGITSDDSSAAIFAEPALQVTPATIAPPAVVVPSGFPFTPGPQVFSAIPNVTGIYLGSYTTQGSSATTNGLIIDITSRSGHDITANVSLEGYLFSGMTGHVNLHGGILLAGNGTTQGVSLGATSMVFAGHLIPNTGNAPEVLSIQSGTFQIRQTPLISVVHQGHFSATNIEITY